MKGGVDVRFMGNSSASINGDGTLTVVADDRFPSKPFMGSGGLFMETDTGLSVLGTGPIRIFTARQAGNQIDGFINAERFTPRKIFKDSLQERWNIYYPDTYNSFPKTVYYKNSEKLIVSSAAASDIAEAELFRMLRHFDEYLKWQLLNFSEYMIKSAPDEDDDVS